MGARRAKLAMLLSVALSGLGWIAGEAAGNARADPEWGDEEALGLDALRVRLSSGRLE